MEIHRNFLVVRRWLEVIISVLVVKLTGLRAENQFW